MARAIWKETVLAESDDTVIVEGNHYFPLDSINAKLFEETATTSHCPWKGEANYFTITVEGDRNPDAAWIYHEPKPAAAEIKDRIAFWRGVTVET